MGCDACEDTIGGTPYRWKAATIEIVACRTHAAEIIAALNAVQSRAAEGG